MRGLLATWRHNGHKSQLSSLDTLAAGAVGGGIQAVPAASIELIKVKLQAQTSELLAGSLIYFWLFIDGIIPASAHKSVNV